MLRILCVEDDEKVRDVLSRFLRTSGHQVREARDGQQAVRLVAQQPFDLILMDLKMPNLDGISAFQEIRRTYPTMKVILTTGYQVDGELEEALLEGKAEFLHKPFTFKDLTCLLDRMQGPQNS